MDITPSSRRRWPPGFSTLFEQSGQGDPSEMSGHGTFDAPDLIPPLPSSLTLLQVCGHSAWSSLLPQPGNFSPGDPHGTSKYSLTYRGVTADKSIIN